MPELRHIFTTTFLLTTILLLTIKYTFEFVYSVNTIDLLYIPILAFFIGMIDITKRLITESHELIVKK
jgi:hypothetical protein